MLVLIELVGPFVAEHVRGGTPWHAHHIAERYGLMVIIALGEGLLGTTAALGALIDVTGWTLDVALLGLAGTAMTFGIWWTYFVVPCGDLLHAYRSRVFGWGYGHIPLFGAVVAHRRRPARGGVLPGAPLRARRHGHADDRGGAADGRT